MMQARGLTAPERVRKVSIVSLPSFPGSVTDADKDTNLVRVTRSSDNHNIVGLGGAMTTTPQPSMTPVETPLPSVGGVPQVNGLPSRAASEECAPRSIPPENQVTCAVEVHREKTKTPTVMMVEQSTTTPMTPETVGPRVSPTPSTTSRSLLPYEYGCMRETIV